MTSVHRSLGVLCAFAVLAFAPAAAAELLNINIADSTALQTLNGIGPSKAQAIIDYRTEHGPFAKIEDIMNVSGIGATTYANIQNYITVGGTPAPQPQAQVQPPPPSQPQAQTPAPFSAAPVPSLTVRITTDPRATAGAGSVFEGQAYGVEDLPIENARYVWNFGDGATAEGMSVFHTYAYPGKYTLVLVAASGMLSGRAKMVVEAVSSRVRLLAESDGSLALHNDSGAELAVGYWTLKRGSGSFAIPEGTLIAAGGGVRFSPAILGLPPGKAELFYPNGSLAAREAMSAHAEGITYLPASQVRAGARSAAPVAKADAAPEEPERLAAPVSQAAAATGSGFSTPLWGSAVGLVALITLGVAATLYGRLPLPASAAGAALSPREETVALAREFEIVDVTPVEEEDPSR